MMRIYKKKGGKPTVFPPNQDYHLLTLITPFLYEKLALWGQKITLWAPVQMLFSYIQIDNVQRIPLNEISPWLDLIAHKDCEYFV